MIHVTGRIITASGEYPEAWVDNAGRLTLTNPGGPADRLDGYVFPGLADSHCHIGLGAVGPVDHDTAIDQARHVVASGVTFVRDLGVPQDMRWIDDLTGVPRILHCGQHIARPKRYLRGYGREIDPADLPTVIAEEAARSDGWVKLVGDWIDRSDGADSDLRPLWPADILADAVAVAHDAGVRVTVHSFATETIDDLLHAGVDGIEHGSGMTADQMDQAVKQKIMITPTALQSANFGAFADQAGTKYPVYAARMKKLFEYRETHMGLIVDSGIDVLMGSDAGGTLPFGALVAEMKACIELGMPQVQALHAATTGGRELLGARPLAEGEPADFVVYHDDPRTNLAVLDEPSAVFIGGVSQSTLQ